MKNIMFELPSDEDVVSCIVTKEMVEEDSAPVLIRRNEQEKITESA